MKMTSLFHNMRITRLTRALLLLPSSSYSLFGTRDYDAAAG